MRSISFRLTALFAVLVTCTTAVLLALGGWLLSRQMLKGIELMHEAEFTEIRSRISHGIDAINQDEIIAQVRQHAAIDAPLYYFQLQNESGDLLFRSANLGGVVLPRATGPQAHRRIEQQPLGRLLVSDFPAGAWRISIASPLSPTIRLLEDYLQVSLLLLGVVAVAGIGLGYAYARFSLAPVRSIQQTAARIRADNLGERIPVPAGRDEISALAQLLNQMFDRLERSFAEVRRFTADASHELKTPLAIIKLDAEKLRPHLAGDSVAAATLDDLLEEIAKLQRIITSLLFLAKADAGVLKPDWDVGNPRDFLNSIREDAEALAGDRGVRFLLARNDEGHCRFEATLTRQLLFNLINNALRVSPAGSTITLASTCSGGDWVLTLTDEGPGLDPAELKRVFERFVRVPILGAEEHDGHGLGLAICQSIAALHGGKIRADNRTDRKGLCVTVCLPVLMAPTNAA